MKWTLNPRAAPPGPYPAELEPIIGLPAHSDAAAEIRSWSGYSPTPLKSAHRLASELDLGQILVKDESHRFGLGSFKALGGAYGVLEAIRSAGDPSSVTVTCASDGNHGRSVAWGARLFGCSAVIYLPAHVTEARAQAIRSLGGRVERVDGIYDDAVALAEEDAGRNGWTVVSDTSYEGYDTIPRLVMQGYTVMAAEALEQMPGGPPTHVFIQGGVGGLAAAVVGHFWGTLGTRRPRAVVVEPAAADGLYQSALAGGPTRSRGSLDTIMAGLSCRDVSLVAWRILNRGASAFVTVEDAGVAPLMRRAARGALGDPFEGGESGVAGLLGLVGAAADGMLRAQLQLDRQARVLAFNTEGATDPGRYRKLVEDSS